MKKSDVDKFFYLQAMCCNNAFCNADADIENFEQKNQPAKGEQPTVNTHATSAFLR